MSDRKPGAFPILLKNDTCSLIQAGGQRLPDPFQQWRGQRLSRARLVTHHHD
jgi:hypothetical protein